MLTQARVAHSRAPRSLAISQRRFLATPPPPTRPAVVLSTPAATTVVTPLPATPVAPAGTIPPSATGTLPLPPPREPKRPRQFFRRFFIYTALGVLTFYPLSGWLSTQYEGYRDFFVETFPGAEAVADYADDHNWETFGAGSVSKKAVQALQKVTGEETKPGSTKEEAANKFRELQRDAAASGKKVEADSKSVLRDLENKAKDAAATVRAKANQVADAGKKEMVSLREGAKEKEVTLREDANRAGAEVKKQTASLREDVHDAKDRAASAFQRESASLSESTDKVVEKAQQKTLSLRESADDVKERATDAVKRETVSLREDASKAAESIKREGMSLRDSAVDAVDRFKSAVKTEGVTLREKATETADKTKAKASEAVSAIVNAPVVKEAERALSKGEIKAKETVDKAEAALKRGEAKVEDAAHQAKQKLEENPGPQGYLDAQRPRELRPETVSPKKPTFDGQTVYKAPLPVGHEPPPGYYVPPPPVSRVKDGEKETLPLLAPKIKEFAASEPIVTQLASTIDSLASSLHTPSSGEPNKILSRAQDDLTALTQHLENVKKTERAQLEKTVAEKTKEFEALLKAKEKEREQGEQGLKQGWEKEKSSMVDNWRGDLEKELESQRQGIEQRLREEVVSQGIELQRRWLRSIKSQVETERGGRLAKLDHLSSSLKQLERITLDNSATLDDNVRLHKVWSALRAVQAKAESGDVSFDEELKLLRSLAPSDKSIASVTLAQLEQSGIAASGVKSFAALASWFSNGVSPRVHSASLVPPPEEASVISHVASATFSKLMFTPKAGLVQGDDVSSTLARAEWCLGEKDLDGAAREINTLKGWPGKLAADWLREARRRLEVQQALEVVGAEATLGSLLLV